MKRSKQIVLLFSGALATTAIPTGCSDGEPQPPEPSPTTPQLSVAAATSSDRKEQQNNSYVPGLGYYQSIYHSWFPYPFNYYYPDWGYYYGGNWNVASYPGRVPPTSVPTPDAYRRAREELTEGGGGHFSRGYSHGFFSGFSSEGVSRGGFGSSFHFSGHGG
jgi:uncharacterized membrane protein YgcG